MKSNMSQYHSVSHNDISIDAIRKKYSQSLTVNNFETNRKGDRNMEMVNTVSTNLDRYGQKYKYDVSRPLQSWASKNRVNISQILSKAGNLDSPNFNKSAHKYNVQDNQKYKKVGIRSNRSNQCSYKKNIDEPIGKIRRNREKTYENRDINMYRTPVKTKDYQLQRQDIKINKQNINLSKIRDKYNTQKAAANFYSPNIGETTPLNSKTINSNSKHRTLGRNLSFGSIQPPSSSNVSFGHQTSREQNWQCIAKCENMASKIKNMLKQ